MEKSYIKHVLTLLDHYEIRGIDLNQAVEDVYNQLRIESHHFPSKKQIKHDLEALIQAGMMRKLSRGYDVTPNATIFARCGANTLLEDLALFACMFSDPHHDTRLASLFNGSFSEEELQAMLPKLFYELIWQSRLFTITPDGRFHLSKMILSSCKRICEEYESPRPPLTSPTILCHYLKTIYPSSKEQWKNKEKEIVAYPYLDEILQVLPRRGIPNNREESRQLQAFYKDTLFHEFDHRCPLCDIHLPHMLIASHIKPFRDCAHLYEPIDNNNGLLLCRNHDYLFDQGFISFQDDGTLLVCNELKHEEDYSLIYHLPMGYKLDESLLTLERKLFLQYHRRHIFQR